LWGGRSPFGIDCSGLAQAFLRFMGLNPPRDSDQQYQAGEPVNGELQPGDLLFFGEHDARVATERYANVSHVAISLGGTDVLHSSSTVGGVKRNSLDPNSPIYHPWLNKTYIGARRYL
jgi:cell wall-associated NlpC family hydrolase